MEALVPEQTEAADPHALDSVGVREQKKDRKAVRESTREDSGVRGSFVLEGRGGSRFLHILQI